MCKHTCIQMIHTCICEYPSYPECGTRGVLVSYEHRGHWFFFRALLSRFIFTGLFLSVLGIHFLHFQ